MNPRKEVTDNTFKELLSSIKNKDFRGILSILNEYELNQDQILELYAPSPVTCRIFSSIGYIKLLTTL